MRKLTAICTLIRPHEWVKNLFVFAPAVFSGRLLDPDVAAASIMAWAFFCAASSFVYIFNDLVDAERDRQHPAKQRRPIPSGAVTRFEAAVLAVYCFLVVQLAALHVMPLWAVLNTYLASGILYSLYLKRKVIVDVLVIAIGFVLRVLAGAAVIDVMPSEWLILCTFLLATFLGFSKRRHELTQLGDSARQHRWVLTLYSPEFLDQMNLITITLTLTCYIFYTIAPETIARFGTRHLLYSVLLVMLGLFRYLFMVHKRGKGSPVEVLYTDRQIVLITLLWLLYMVWFIYDWPVVKTWLRG
ncbi:MAG: decaprenyl-phosphate phosphoribosyltransferase [Candidatus Omnitrophica bacterium]|nr:decaprenyl-phosphate phosphoribosyltransferase [Candidatus Omnitrophota bacterium]